MKSTFFFFLALSLCINFSILAENLAEIRAIDRVTGRSFKLKVPLEEEVTFSNLILNIKYCYKNPIDKEIENYAYLIVKDKIMNELVFQGWMFSSSPSLSSLEHPVNDIWLLNCTKKIAK
tara:strand:+ start:258 stop:617 length:360 start_codon:yes stop_codon:yes gene_type:complete